MFLSQIIMLMRNDNFVFDGAQCHVCWGISSMHCWKAEHIMLEFLHNITRLCQKSGARRYLICPVSPLMFPAWSIILVVLCFSACSIKSFAPGSANMPQQDTDIVSGVAGSSGSVGQFPATVPSSGSAGVFPNNAREVLPSRAFAGPLQYPPNKFKAYGILAFTSNAVPENRARYLMICRAYSAKLLMYSVIDTPLADQLVTIWPVMRDKIANLLNNLASEADDGSIPKLCRSAVDSYDLRTAQYAIDAARYNGASLDGVGPFLLAWSPSTDMDMQKAPVLVLDLSGVDNYKQAQKIFLDWSHYIVKNSKLWKNGWSVEKLRIEIRLFADRYGAKIVRLFGGSG